jgi:predicted dehydrogenase
VSVRVGFLGGGFIATYHARMLHGSGADHRIVAVHDPDVAKAEAFAAASGAEVKPSVDEVVDAADAVYVCTWTAEHPALVARVAAAGRAVFCEKPLATDLAGALDMVDTVASAGVVNQVGLVLRDSPSMRWLRHLVADPAVGRIMAVVFRDDQYLPVQGIYGSDWRADPARAGAGTLLEHSIHDVDLLEWLGGEIVGVTAHSASFHGIDGIEDVVSATYRLAGGGAASLTSVWHDLLERPSQRRIEVLCERGFFALEGDVFGPVRWSRPEGDDGTIEGADLLAALEDGVGPVRNPDGAFVEAVGAGGSAHPDFSAALRPHLLVDATYRSCANGGAPVAVASGRPSTGPRDAAAAT